MSGAGQRGSSVREVAALLGRLLDSHGLSPKSVSSIAIERGSVPMSRAEGSIKAATESGAVALHRLMARGDGIGAAVSRVNGADIVGIELAGDAHLVPREVAR